MTQHLSIRLSAALFAVSMLLAAALTYHLSGAIHFGFALTPEAATTLTARIQAIRAIGLGIAVLLMLFVVLAASRASRNTLALRWVVGAATSVAFLRGAGLIGQLPQQDSTIIAASAFQLALEGAAILLLYGDDAAEWFDARGRR